VKSKSSVFIIIAVFSVAIFALVSFARTMDTKREQLSIQLRQSLDTQANISLIIHQLGYTGLIHNFKNYILRGDETYYQAAQHNLRQLEQQLDNSHVYYRKQSLESSIKLIEQAVTHYELNLELARRLRNQGLSVQQIDQQVKVDDTLASNAIRDLIGQYQVQSANLLRDQLEREQGHNHDLYVVVALSLMITIAACAICWLLVVNVRNELAGLQKISSRQKLLDASPNPILVVTEAGEIVVANHGAGKLFECDKDTLIGRTIEDFIPDSLRVQHAHYRTLFFHSGGERTMRNPVELTTEKGELKRVEVQIGLYRLDQEQFAVVHLLDVSKVEDMQRHAEEIEQTFRMTFQLAPVGIAQISLEGRFIKVNRQFANLLEYQASDLEQLSIDDVTPVEDRAANQMAIDRLIDSAATHVRLEKCYKSSTGADVWVINTLALYRNVNNQPEYLISILEDVSYRRKYEEELLASEAKFRSIANHVQGVVWMATPGIDSVMFVSNRYEEIWGRSIESLKQSPQSFIEGILPEDRPKVIAEIENHRKGIWKVAYRILGRDGSIRYIHDEGAPVRGANGELLCLVGLARDVTEEHLAKERLKSSNRQLEQLAKFDPLTMAIRRPYSIADLEECIALHKRYATFASLVFIDLNDFKDVNDNYGHEAGDQVLSRFAACVRENIRETDTFYRYAGDEFLLLLRETNCDETAGFLRKLNAALEDIKVEEYPDVVVSISCGIVTLGDDPIADANSWINCADERMYEHKRQLKNKGQS